MHKINYFKVYKSVVFSKLTMLFQNISIAPERNFVPIKVLLPIHFSCTCLHLVCTIRLLRVCDY